MVDFNHHNNGDDPEKPGGRGEEPYLTPVQKNKIVASMLNPRRRWKVTKALKDEAILATRLNLTNDDARVVNGAVHNILRMEAQNQKDHLGRAQELENHITNQQINIYLPANGREETNGHLTNGNGNGHH